MCTLIKQPIILWKMEKHLNYPRLHPDLALSLTLSGSNYVFNKFTMVPKLFEPLNFDCSNFPKVIRTENLPSTFSPFKLPKKTISHLI